MADDIDALLPARSITIKGEALSVSPFFFGQIPRAVKLMQPLADALRSANVVQLNGQAVTLAADWPLKVPQIVAEGGEALMDLLAFVVAQPREWFNTLAADEGIALTKLVFEVNADFFVKKIAPMLPVQIKSQQAEPIGGESSAS